jgi:hypothetical protein
MISLLLLSGGDRSNGLEWGRCVLLVHRRIRRCRAPPGLSFCSYRYTDNPCGYFVHRPGIFLLSDMDFEQTTIVVALCNYLNRTSKVSLFSEQPDSVIALRFLCFKPSGEPGAGSRQADAIRLKSLTPNVWFSQRYSGSTRFRR